MDVKELRIGNYVNAIGSDRVVLGISQYNQITRTQTDRYYFEFDSIIPVNEIHVKPIPITEEWLLKFGFTKIVYSKKETRYMMDNNYYCDDYYLCFDGDWVFRINEYTGISLCEVKYLHEIQNIYYSLTKEEIKIKSDITVNG